MTPIHIRNSWLSPLLLGITGLLLLFSLLACGGSTSSTPTTRQPTTQASGQGSSSKTCPIVDTLHSGTFTNVVITLPPGCVVNFVVTKVGHFKAGFPNQTPGDYKFNLGKSYISNVGVSTLSETITANFTGSYQVVPFSQRACDPANC
jgi:hypothetical protein